MTKAEFVLLRRALPVAGLSQGDWWLLAPKEVVGVWILDIEGQRVAIAARSWPETTAATKAEFRAILDSMVFTAAP